MRPAGEISMNVHDRIDAVLRGDLADRVPFTIYRGMIPTGAAERALREKGLGYWWRRRVIDWEHPNCGIRTVRYREEGQDFQRTTWATPVGEVHETHRLGGLYGSSWQTEWPVKTREDYRVMEFVTRDARPVALFEDFEKTVRDLGGDGYVVAHFGYTPLMAMLVNIVGFETAAYHMVDFPDEFWGLHAALSEKARRGYRIVARGPQKLILYGGNTEPAVLGRERFAEYVVPCYNELGDRLHEEGKLLGVHLDSNNAAWKDIIADSEIDVVEAFTPPPDCDLSVADACEAWPEKVLSLNFPSSVHLADAATIRDTTRDILSQAGSGARLIMGITEDIPEDRWEESLNAIADALNEGA